VAGDLIERSGALAPIEQALAEAQTGTGNLAFVSGPAGVGKTALVGRAVDLARIAGFTVLSGVGTELELGFPFGVVRQLYGGLARDRSRLEEQRAIAPLFGPADDGYADLDVSFQVLDGLYWLVADLAEAAPLLIVVDDVQWADEPSLRHLLYLCRRLDGLRATVLTAARSEAQSTVLDDLSTLASRRIEPQPLTRKGVAEMVRQVLGREPSPGFTRACLAQTGGYPLYVGELLREAKRRGISPDDAVVGELESVDANGLAAHVWRRVEAAGSDAGEVAGLVSVLGGRAQPARIALLSGVRAARVAEVLDALIDSGVLKAGEPPGFAHPIVQAAVRARLSPAQRDAWNRAAARLLDSEGADVHEVAAHLLKCEPDNDAWAAERLAQSARAVLGRGAPDAAARALRRAMAEMPAREVLVGLLCDLARAEDAADDPAAALTRYEQALRLAEGSCVRAEIAVAKAQTLSLLGRSNEATGILEDTMRGLDGSERELEQRVEAELIVQSFLSTDHRAAEHALQRLARYAGRLPDGPAAQAALSVMAVAAVLNGQPAAQAADLAERALRAGGFRSGGFSTEVWSSAAWTLILADRPDVAQELTEGQLPTARREGHPREISVMLGTLSLAAWRRGDLPAAVSWADTALAVSSEGIHQPWGHGFKALALLDAGDIAAAEQALAATGPEHWSEIARGSTSLYYARAQLRLKQNRLAEATVDLEQMRRRIETLPGFSILRDVWTPVEALVAHRAGEVQRARGLAADLVEAARAFGAAGVLGPNLRMAAIVGEPEERLGRLQEAVGLLEPSCYRLEYARTLIELGAALRRRGERTASREPLSDGLEIAYRCGAGGDVARALEELRASGARPRRPVRTGAQALTPSELRIARLAAAGRSNRQIAQELYVTVKTVEGTLGKAYLKLGLSGRGAREALPGALGPLHQGL
jgi:DNA-binding CsgD family transcriptional regulator